MYEFARNLISLSFIELEGGKDIRETNGLANGRDILPVYVNIILCLM